MSACTQTHIYTHTHARTHAHPHTHTHARTHTHAHTHTHTHTHTNTHTHNHTHTTTHTEDLQPLTSWQVIRCKDVEPDLIESITVMLCQLDDFQGLTKMVAFSLVADFLSELHRVFQSAARNNNTFGILVNEDRVLIYPGDLKTVVHACDLPHVIVVYLVTINIVQ